MKLTKQELATIAQQELRALLKEIRFKKMTPHEQGYSKGSKEEPCQKPGGSYEATGNRLFDPHVNPRSKDEWECNTQIEDELHDAIANFIAKNSTKKIVGRIGDFILKHFDNKTNPKLPLHRYTKETPLYRGSGRVFNNYGFEFLENVQWDQGVEFEKGITKYPFNSSYKLRRPVASFSDDFKAAASFMKQDLDHDCVFIYETKGNTQTAEGGFFLDLTGMYDLRRNMDYKMSHDGSIKFKDVRSFANESEVLLIGAKRGDSIPIDYVYIDTDHLNTRMGRLQELNPELHNTIRKHIEYSEKQKRKAKSELNQEIRFLEQAVDIYIPDLKANGDLKKVDYLIFRIQRRIDHYIKQENLYKAIGLEEKYKTFMDGMDKLFKTLQSLKPAPKSIGQ